MSIHPLSGNRAPIFVFGHQNPDTDSAVVAAQLKAELNPGQFYQPLLLGKLNCQTRWLFADAGESVPPIRTDLRHTAPYLLEQLGTWRP